jgi:hypothetical protein
MSLYGILCVKNQQKTKVRLREVSDQLSTRERRQEIPGKNPYFDEQIPGCANLNLRDEDIQNAGASNTDGVSISDVWRFLVGFRQLYLDSEFRAFLQDVMSSNLFWLNTTWVGKHHGAYLYDRTVLYPPASGQNIGQHVTQHRFSRTRRSFQFDMV